MCDEYDEMVCYLCWKPDVYACAWCQYIHCEHCSGFEVTEDHETMCPDCFVEWKAMKDGNKVEWEWSGLFMEPKIINMHDEYD